MESLVSALARENAQEAAESALHLAVVSFRIALEASGDLNRMAASLDRIANSLERIADNSDIAKLI